MSRRLRDSHHNEAKSDRWIISYADFITLLFAFFVVLYALSSVQEGKYKIFAAHMDASFSSISSALLPLRFGNGSNAATQKPLPRDFFTDGSTSQSHVFVDKDHVEIASELKTSLKGLIDEKKILFQETDYWVEISLNANVVFVSASSQLTAEGISIIKVLAKDLNVFQNPIQVEGFTDNVPIKNEQYPSNWELSATRSSAVIRQLAAFGIDDSRMAAVGYGQNFPVRDNATPNGREANRRVVLLIAKQPSRERLGRLREQWLSMNSEVSAPSIASKPNEVKPEGVQIEGIPLEGGGTRYTRVPERTEKK